MRTYSPCPDPDLGLGYAPRDTALGNERSHFCVAIFRVINKLSVNGQAGGPRREETLPSMAGCDRGRDGSRVRRVGGRRRQAAERPTRRGGHAVLDDTGRPYRRCSAASSGQG
jgi:hypothetical protein